MVSTNNEPVLILGRFSIPNFLNAIRNFWSQVSTLAGFADKEFSRLMEENPGDAQIVLHCIINVEILGVTQRIRQHVLPGGAEEAWRLKESFRDALSMEAVAAAIISQIAITLLSLGNFDRVHWTATAFAYTSLICGLLSTYFAFAAQHFLSSFHSPEEVRGWLLTSNQPIPQPQAMFDAPEHSTAVGGNTLVPSVRAAAVLTTPSKLIRLSNVALFVAIGIYLGCVYHAGLGNLDGRNANLAVLLFFVCIFTFVVCESALPMPNLPFAQPFVTQGETRNLSGGQSGTELGALNAGPDAISSTDIIRDALAASIRAQEESVKAQRVLLDFLRSQRTNSTNMVSTTNG
ncbi:hypothetical protein BJX64DRAFT_288385 [Aspergillus heterothallicus]